MDYMDVDEEKDYFCKEDQTGNSKVYPVTLGEIDTTTLIAVKGGRKTKKVRRSRKSRKSRKSKRVRKPRK